MLKDKHNVRTDYHELLSSTGSVFPVVRYSRLFKAMIVFMLGFVSGIIYSKAAVSFRSETIAFSSVNENSVQSQADKLRASSKA